MIRLMMWPDVSMPDPFRLFQMTPKLFFTKSQFGYEFTYLGSGRLMYDLDGMQMRADYQGEKPIAVLFAGTF